MERCPEIFFFLLVLFFSCGHKNNDTVIAPVTDSGKANVSTLKHDTIALIKPAPEVLKRWEKYWQIRHTDFSLADFSQRRTTAFTLSREGSENDFAYYKNAGILSPDGSYIVYYENGGGGGDAESVAYLINTKNKAKYLIDDIGSEGLWDDAGWIDSTAFILTARWRDLEKKQFGLYYVVYNPDTREKTIYTFNKHYHYDNW